MKVIRDDTAGTFTLVPVAQTEKDLFVRMVPLLKKGDTFKYGGRQDDGEYCKVHLHFGSTSRKKTEIKGKMTINKIVHEGGIHFVIEGTTDEDKNEVGGLRDSCFFGSARPIFLDTVEVEGEKAIVITLKLCKHCQAPMVSLAACSWSTCGACAKKCEHKYKRGFVHGGDMGTGAMGEYCVKCGRGKPLPKGERVKTDAENKVEVEKELGFTWLYTNTPLTPAQIVAAEKAAGIIPAK